MIPSIGRIVLYRLSAEDVVAIKGNRTVRPTGNAVNEGEIYPAMIVRTWGNTEGSCCQLQVFLDGADTYWATSRREGQGPATWFVPPRV